ncbi:MAG: hypothetical protein PHE02_12545 [Lachnospiraceae bacterium]|nr:hypothetical protein [Lachnospiraceae bacterium]
MGDKNPKRPPKQKKVSDKNNKNLHSEEVGETEFHGKTKKSYM